MASAVKLSVTRGGTGQLPVRAVAAGRSFARCSVCGVQANRAPRRSAGCRARTAAVADALLTSGPTREQRSTVPRSIAQRDSPRRGHRRVRFQVPDGTPSRRESAWPGGGASAGPTRLQHAGTRCREQATRLFRTGGKLGQRYAVARRYARARSPGPSADCGRHRGTRSCRLAMLAPLKTVQPITLLVDRQTGFVQALDPQSPQRVVPTTP